MLIVSVVSYLFQLKWHYFWSDLHILDFLPNILWPYSAPLVFFQFILYLFHSGKCVVPKLTKLRTETTFGMYRYPAGRWFSLISWHFLLLKKTTPRVSTIEVMHCIPVMDKCYSHTTLSYVSFLPDNCYCWKRFRELRAFRIITSTWSGT